MLMVQGILLYLWVFVIGLFAGRMLSVFTDHTPGSDLFRFGPKSSIYNDRQAYDRYLRLEFLTAVLFVIVFLQNGFTKNALLLCVLTCLLLMAGSPALKGAAVPLKVVLCIAACAVLFIILNAVDAGNPHLPERIAGALIVSLPLFLFNRLHAGIIGESEIYLAAAGGLLLGYEGMIIAFLLALILAGIRKLTGGKKISFSVYLSVGIWFSAVFSIVVIILWNLFRR